MLGHFRQKGDTMIEVLLAVTIFSVVAVMGLTIMNQGSAASQRSLEITQVRNEIEAQATTLRFMYDAALAQRTSAGYDASAPVDPNSPAGRWSAVTALRKPSAVGATSFDAMVTGTNCIAPAAITNAFIVNPRTAQVYTRSGNVASWVTASIFSRVRFAAATPGNPHPTAIAGVEGIWVEAVERQPVTVAANDRIPGYTDFHIRACWKTVGQVQPASLGTFVRLFEP